MGSGHVCPMVWFIFIEGEFFLAVCFVVYPFLRNFHMKSAVLILRAILDDYVVIVLKHFPFLLGINR